ncbi:MAG: non-canonical purine NTP diphosphatase [Cyclobacteriaceae bacterium]|nr:non-canonical purine NTP diphosphatase [Cyclobacteriaceae bacterium]
MKRLCFATNNHNKLKEINAILGASFQIISLEEIGCSEELPETQATLEGNSKQKSRYVFEKYDTACFADDTGLEIEALEGEPGVFSARYAGPQRNNEDNIDLVLQNLKGKLNRKAQFRTVITLTTPINDYQFEGIVKGQIVTERIGEKGFGYDAVFMPEGHETTFGEMSAEEKNKISHRGRAIKKLVEFLSATKDY